STKEERPILGESLTARIRVVRHDCRTGDQMHIGKTSQGTEVYLNKLFAEADVKVIAGVVEPHLYAGYSGGREGVLPGVSAIETVHQNMSLALDRKAERGVLEGNPVHEDMVEAAQLADVDFALNAVLNGNREIAEAFAGDVNEAFDESVKLVDKVCRVPVGGRADLVFISPGGSPFDGSLFEACKCLDAASEVTKRGKIIVLMAECVDGYGNREFYEAASRFKDSKALGKSLKKRFSVGGFMAYRLRKTLQSARMVLVSVLPDYYVSESLGMKAARTANDAYRYASDTVGRNGKVSFIPYGNLTMPTVKPAD
ncbi:MAG: nickel-dependent lactate racemase, partial [Candidatus Bathyarchaeota archaeon]|nr:nickel-dependent lactate racemase [Candidatus Bathyarchaeota archaeon]